MHFSESNIPGAADVLKSVVGVGCQIAPTGEIFPCLWVCRPLCGHLQCIIVHYEAAQSLFPDIYADLAVEATQKLSACGYDGAIQWVDAEVSRDPFTPRKYEIHSVTLRFSRVRFVAIMSQMRADEVEDILQFLDPVVRVAEEMKLL